MEVKNAEDRASPPSSSRSSSCIVVESPARTHDSTSTDPTSVSSQTSKRLETTRQSGRNTARSSSFKAKAKDTLPGKSRTAPDLEPAESSSNMAPKTRRSPRRPQKEPYTRHASSSTGALLVKSQSKAKEPRESKVAKSSILNYFAPTRDAPAKRKRTEDDPQESETTKVSESPKKKPRFLNELLNDGVKAIGDGWNVDRLGIPTQLKPGTINSQSDRRRSTRVSATVDAVASTTSNLEKKGRNVLSSSKEKLRDLTKATDHGKRKAGEAETSATDKPASKRTKLTMSSEPKTVTVTEERLIRPPSLSKKTWLSTGLYVGQKRGFNVTLSDTKKKNASQSAEGEAEAAPKENKVLPLPMFGGEYLLKRGRHFKLPFDVFSPLPPGQPRPDEWWKKQANRFIGEAATEWKKTKPLPPSRCLCRPEDGCDENCQNRYMLYECDEDNCSIGPEYCTNRSFAELKERRNSGKKYQIGVEVIKTADKGFGVRSCRTFEPHQIIVEYTGEIITQDECERRITEIYKDNESYYLMVFDQNMIIDATRGSIARFVNHSCEPNCRMVKWTVAGKPRMALFAGDKGIMTGEELSYDYNFDPFSQKNVKECRCGAARCRGVLGPKLSEEKETKLIEELREKRRLEELAAKKAEQKKKREKEKKPKGSGIWGGGWDWA